jgi:hypothetical protein
MRHRWVTLAFSAVILRGDRILDRHSEGLLSPDDTLDQRDSRGGRARRSSMLQLRSLPQLAAKDTNVQSYTANIGSFGGREPGAVQHHAQAGASVRRRR